MDRERWLVAIAAALGVSADACARDAERSAVPVAAYEVPSAAPGTTPAPSVTASPIASATPVPTAIATAPAQEPPPQASCGEVACSSGGKKACAAASCSGAPAPVANAQSTVAALAPRFRMCFTTSLKNDPNATGSVTLTADIAYDGTVIRVSAGQTTLPSTLVLCLLAIVQRATFPATGQSQQLSIPLRFTK